MIKLGKLEKAVLQYLWQTGEADAKQVHAYLRQTRGGTLNTIQSTLERLFRKELLSREKHSHAYIYRPEVSREELVGNLITDITKDFLNDGEDALQAAFVSMSNSLTPSRLEELERLIRERKQHYRNDDEGEE